MRVLLVWSKHHLQARMVRTVLRELGVTPADTCRAVTMRACRQFLPVAEHLAVGPQRHPFRDPAVLRTVLAEQPVPAAVPPPHVVPSPSSAPSSDTGDGPSDTACGNAAAEATCAEPAQEAQPGPTPPPPLPRGFARITGIARRTLTSSGRRYLAARLRARVNLPRLDAERMGVLWNTVRSARVRRWFADSDLVVALDADAASAMWLLLPVSKRPQVVMTAAAGQAALARLDSTRRPDGT